MTSIKASVAEYETWLDARLDGGTVLADLAAKHERMRESPFLFLRGTCWRWAELAGSLCPELMDAPRVVCVGDAHVGNFGLWRDAEARLVWGVNDYDEAALTPYALDLVRLCASAALAAPNLALADCASAILAGYAGGRKKTRPCVLETRHLWLRRRFLAAADDRQRFWTKLRDLADAGPAAPEPYRTALAGRLPSSAGNVATAPRRAGVGSLGRPRYVAVTSVGGAPVAREVKCLLPSCWDRAGIAGAGLAASRGRFRSPDPWLSTTGTLQVRRLAPDSRKLDTERGTWLDARLLDAMGRDLAAIHLDAPDAAAAITDDLAARPGHWLARAAERALEANERDWKRYR